jgi:tetratricopeptide (TPR) repeat protein
VSGARGSAARASDRGVARYGDYLRNGAMPHLQAAVGHFREAADTAPADDPERPKYLSNHGGALLHLLERAGDPAILDQAVARLREAVEATPVAHPLRAFHLSNLGLALQNRFGRAGQEADLNEAVAIGRRAVDAALADDPRVPMYLSNLGDALRVRAERTGLPEDLDQAIARLSAAVRAASARAPDRPLWLSNLGNALLARFERSGQLADLDQAIAWLSEAVEGTRRDPGRAMYLSNLGNALLARFDHTGRIADLDQAIARLSEAVGASLADHPGRPKYLSNLGIALRARFERTGEQADLERAIASLSEAVGTVPADRPDRATIASNLGDALLSRFDHTGRIADLDQAITWLRSAVGVATAGYPDGFVAVCNLGLALQARFERTGRIADLDQAIAGLSDAVDAVPADHPRRPVCQSNLGGALLGRFERSGQLADLDRAITALSEASGVAPAEHPGQPAYLSNLGTALRYRFGRTGLLADLDRAIAAGQRALEATPGGHPRRAAYLSNLGNALHDRFERTGQQADLDQAIAMQAEAVDTTPVGHPERAMRLSNLGGSQTSRFVLTRRRADLDQAVSWYTKAVDATPADHPNRTVFLFNLGTALRVRFVSAGDPGDLDEAIQAFRRAAEMPTASPGRAVAAARAWGQCALQAGNPASAVDGYARAIELLPLVAWHGLDQATREHHLEAWAGLAPDAAAAAVAAGDPARAVELLEAGRSILWTQALHLRQDLAALRAVAPELAMRLEASRLLLDAPATSMARGLGTADEAGLMRAAERRMLDERRQGAQDWDAAVAQVRQLESFTDFLRPAPFASLREAAAQGPVIIVNVSRHGSHALIVTRAAGSGDGPAVLTVDLPAAPISAVADQADALRGAQLTRGNPDVSRPEREGARDTAFNVLAWTWETIAEPVLTALGHENPPAGDFEHWPRVWWCPAGPAAALPLHAAGRHPRTTAQREVMTELEATADSVAGRVISSYTPTLAAVTRARARPAPGPVRQLAVGIPETSGDAAGVAPLTAVAPELEIVARYLPSPEQATHLLGAAATRRDVLDALPGHSWLHLSCHGAQDPADPSRSAFFLYDQPLTLADLTALNLPETDLAYLAACQTATGDRRLPDEALHLAGALQLAGYRHVLATLWNVSDRYAPRVADIIYAYLLNSGPGRPQASQAPYALQHAVARLRQDRPGEPLLWATYIHLGP